MAEPVIDICFPYRVQGLDAIEPLLDAAQAEDISWERQALGAAIAAELAVRHGSRHQIVKNVLQKLSQKIRAFEANFLIDQSLALLDGEIEDPLHNLLLIKQEVLKTLPEEKPPVVIGGDFTVRRPIPKIGRNAPCPCGSGKKYKKCCYEKDQQLLRDPSPYEGITMTQLRSTPSLVADADMIREMRAYELKKLQPAKLNEEQLNQAYLRADHFGMREFGYDMLLELKDRPDREDFALKQMEDLLDSALDVGDIDVARKIMDLIPPEMLRDAEAVKFRFDFVENREHYEALEARCRQALQEEDDEDLFKWDYTLLALSYGFENIFPAMSINLQAEINLQQHERRQLRKELREAQKKLRVREARKTPTLSTDEQSAGLEFETTPKKIMIPEFSAAYRRSCETAPSAVVAKSLQAAAGFAAHDKQIWRQTKGIETIPHIYRIRVGIHHRLMIQWEKEKGLKVLDLIPRAQLETWIRQRAM